eukprot:3939084-Lingulodinium_polyedra.AAC.1
MAEALTSGMKGLIASGSLAMELQLLLAELQSTLATKSQSRYLDAARLLGAEILPTPPPPWHLLLHGVLQPA